MSISRYYAYDTMTATGAYYVRTAIYANDRAAVAKIWPVACAEPGFPTKRNKPHGPERKGKGGKVKRW